MAFQVTFWGTRGSIPTPGPNTARYGGNTPSVALTTMGPEGKAVTILDAGTGVRPLGNALVANGSPVSVDLLVSHTHWDHIQGLPFFAPLQRNTVRIWGARQGGVDLVEILRNQMSPVVFPVPLDELAAELSVHHVEPGDFAIGDFQVTAARCRHPGNTLGYKLRERDNEPAVVYVPDNELGPGGDYEVEADWRSRFVEFIGGAAVLVHDAMFTPAELEQHPGWGHSTNLEAVALAVEAEVDQLVLFHHRPEHDDDTVDAMLAEARDAAKQMGSRVDVIAAHEGLELTL